jgi:Polyketide cyclase / dehydrase and lipid transport
MLKRILLAIGVLIVGLCALIASRPPQFAVERSAVFAAASPEAVFAQVNDFHKWEAWSPWEKLDPDMKRTFGGPETGGVGATYAWVGNDKVGEGVMEILESKPGELVKFKLSFIKPFEDTSISTLTFAKEGEGTKVSWKMEGENTFVSKAFGLFMDMDKMIGDDFEKGLGQMKTAAEAHQAKLKADAEAAAKAEAEKKAADEAAAANAVAVPTSP